MMSPNEEPQYWFMGLLSTQVFPNGNLVSATAQWIVHQKRQGKVYMDTLEALLACEKKAGVWSRYPNTLENTSYDDFICAAACDRGIAYRIHARGEEDAWIFDLFEDHPGLTENNFARWLGKNPSFVAHICYSAGLTPGWALTLSWVVSIAIAARKSIKNQDGWMQSHLQILSYESSGQTNWLCNLVVAYWRKKKPVPMREIVADYIGTKNHPLVEVWED